MMLSLCLSVCSSVCASVAYFFLMQLGSFRFLLMQFAVSLVGAGGRAWRIFSDTLVSLLVVPGVCYIIVVVRCILFISDYN